MIQRILRVLVAIAGLVFLVLGISFLLAPGGQVERFALFPSGNSGYNTLRGDFGAFFLGTAIFCFIGAVRGAVRWLIPPATFMALVVIGRLYSFFIDGPAPGAIPMLWVEILILAVLLLAIRSLRHPARFGLRAWGAIAALLILTLGAGVLFERPLGLAFARRTITSSIQRQAWVSELPDGLHAGLCGSGSPLADPTRSGPCVFVVAGKHLYIVDSGEGSARKLALMGVQSANIDAVLLTHFHSDHIADLGELMIERWAGASHKDQTPVYGPQGVEKVVEGFNHAYELDAGYRTAHHGAATMPPSGAGGIAHVVEIPDGSDASQKIIEQDGVSISMFPVNHAPVQPAVGYRFDYRGRSIVISGDTAASPVLEKNARGVDVLFHEGLQTDMVSIMHEVTEANNRPAGAKILGDIPSYHTRPEDAAKIAQTAGVGHLVFYHTIPPLPMSFLNAAFLGDAAKFYKGPITVSKDGTFVSLPAGNKQILLRELL
jgi:ribonuclease Z